MKNPSNLQKAWSVFEQGYDIDRAYAEADLHAAGSDAWHYWMDEAERLEKLHREG